MPSSGWTSIQQIGLRYYAGFQPRNPCTEVTEAVAIIRDSRMSDIVLDVLQVCVRVRVRLHLCVRVYIHGGLASECQE